MAAHRITASALIPARPEDLYAIIADYQKMHPQILPRPPFVDLVVEQGGTGAGTVFLARMSVLGQIQSFRGVITEPEPGRVLVETTDTGYVTTFIIEPRDNAQAAYVTIDTKVNTRPGVFGALERWLVTRLLHPTYVRELENLATVAKAQAA